MIHKRDLTIDFNIDLCIWESCNILQGIHSACKVSETLSAHAVVVFSSPNKCIQLKSLNLGNA